MITVNSLKEQLKLRKEENRLVIPVPWGYAEAVQTELRKAGVRTTLSCDLQEREAHLEVWPGQDEGLVREVLNSAKVGTPATRPT